MAALSNHYLFCEELIRGFSRSKPISFLDVCRVGWQEATLGQEVPLCFHHYTYMMSFFDVFFKVFLHGSQDCQRTRTHSLDQPFGRSAPSFPPPFLLFLHPSPSSLPSSLLPFLPPFLHPSLPRSLNSNHPPTYPPTHPHTHAHTHARTHARTHAHTHTHTHT